LARFPGMSASFESPAESLGRLACLLVANVGVAHGSADVFVAKQLLDSRKSFPTWLRRIAAALCRNPGPVISPFPIGLHAARSRRLNARLENGFPEYPANTNSLRRRFHQEP
jgi:hypothetical protein